MNPMFMFPAEYGRVLDKYGHTPEQYQWRYEEYLRFRAAIDEVLKTSRFREVLSRACLERIAETGVCRLPSMYFANVGVIEVDARDCVAMLDGYIRCLNSGADLQVIVLDDEDLFRPNSCWHIKSNKHIMIHSWNTDRPVMAYSAQLLLIDEFQRHFAHIWNSNDTGSGSRRATVALLTAIRDRCAAHIAD